MSTALLVLPDFLLIALGWLLYRKLGYTREFFEGAEKLGYYALFPAVLLSSILRTPITPENALALVESGLLTVGGGWVLGSLARPALKPAPMAHASVMQCGYRFNTILGLALSASLGGPASQTMMALLTGLAVPFANVAAVHSLARHNGGNLLRELSRNPLVIATTLGIAGNLAGVTMPRPVDIFLSRLGAAALTIGLLCLGASLTWQAARGKESLMTWMLVCKLLCVPLLALLAGYLLGMSRDDARTLLLFGALPTAPSAYVLAVRMGGDGPLVALTVSLGTVLSALTIPFWLEIFS